MRWGTGIPGGSTSRRCPSAAIALWPAWLPSCPMARGQRPRRSRSGLRLPPRSQTPPALAALHPAPKLDGGGTERWPWRLTTTVLVVLVLAGLLGWVWFSPSPQPTVLKITQITHFGRVAAPGRLVTDGTRLFFVERQGGRETLAAVPVEGGEPVPVPTPFPNTALYGISPDHSELLVRQRCGWGADALDAAHNRRVAAPPGERDRSRSCLVSRRAEDCVLLRL